MSDDIVKQARDPIAEARRVLADDTYLCGTNVAKLREALANLLSHVERLTAHRVRSSCPIRTN